MKTPFLFAAMLCSLSLQAGEWQVKPQMPSARQEIYAAATDQHVYIPGGVKADGLGTSAAFEAYDVNKHKWLVLKSLPEARHHITPAIVGNKVYAIGGFEGPFPEWVMKADTFVYDMASDSWHDGTALPEPLGEHIAAVSNGKIHVIGGRKEGKGGKTHFDAYDDTTAHYIYDPESANWTRGKPAPTARNSAAAAVINGLVYVVGGRRNVVQEDGTQLQQNLTTLEVYNPKTDSWQTRTAMPEALGGNAAAALNGKLYVFGGEQWAPEQKVFASAWVYDPRTDKWQAEADMPSARHGLAAASAKGSVITIGGGTKVGGGGAVGNTEILQP